MIHDELYIYLTYHDEYHRFVRLSVVVKGMDGKGDEWKLRVDGVEKRSLGMISLCCLFACLLAHSLLLRQHATSLK